MFAAAAFVAAVVAEVPAAPAPPNVLFIAVPVLLCLFAPLVLMFLGWLAGEC